MQKKRVVWFAAPAAVAVMAGALTGSALASEDPARELAAISADDVGQGPFAYDTNTARADVRLARGRDLGYRCSGSGPRGAPGWLDRIRLGARAPRC